MDDYEFHYPAELSARTSRKSSRRSTGTGSTARSGLHLDPRFAKGGFSSPDDATRGSEAIQVTLEAIDLAGEIGAHMIIWPGIEGYNYPFQTPYTESWTRFIDGVGEVARTPRERGVTMFLEHKNSEPAMKIFMRNIGMTLHVIHTLRTQGIDNVGQHGLAAPDHERREPRRIRRAARRRRACSATSTRTPAGAPSTTTTWSAPRRSWRRSSSPSSCTARTTATNGERLGFDLYPYTEDAVGAVKRSRPAVELHRRRRGEDRRRRAPEGAARRRTRSARTSSSTPRSARDRSRTPRRDRRRHVGRQGHRDLAAR